ncbi:MAG: phage major capsid protein [Proteobacteria bacterium]|jgi:HK97 family phage major capsid protein|nr:phage major capsid protein [Alphaproteobacteria bacterium]NCC03360.1 phage major capsid protein [Pseudomonadota bacterium]
MIDMYEVQTASETLAQAFEEYKSVNDQRLLEIERKGTVDVLVDEKLGRMDGSITKLQGELTQVKTALARPSLSGKTATTFDDETSHYKSAFMSYVTKGVEPDRALMTKAMSVINDDRGGYMVPSEMSERIVTRQQDTTPMRQIATVMSISSEAVEMLRDTNDADAQWISELGTRDDTDEGTIGRIRIPVHELFAQPKATQKLMDDSIINVEEWLVNRIADKFARRENAAFVSGDGVGQPRGFLSYTTAATSDSTRSWGVLEHVATGADGAFASSNGADALITLMNKLKAGYLSKASWLMPRSVVDAVRKFKESGTGAYIWQPSLQAGTPATLLGYPVILADDMQSMGSGSLSVAFGNFEEGYTIVDRIGLQVLRDPYTAAPFVKFRCSKRVGGDVVNFDAIKVMKFATA